MKILIVAVAMLSVSVSMAQDFKSVVCWTTKVEKNSCGDFEVESGNAIVLALEPGSIMDKNEEPIQVLEATWDVFGTGVAYSNIVVNPAQKVDPSGRFPWIEMDFGYRRTQQFADVTNEGMESNQVEIDFTNEYQQEGYLYTCQLTMPGENGADYVAEINESPEGGPGVFDDVDVCEDGGDKPGDLVGGQ